jgi:hypothetical protein
MTESKLADDLLTGAQEIADFLGWPVDRVYYAQRKRRLPIGKHGELLIARKSQLDRALSGEAAVSAKEVA